MIPSGSSSVTILHIDLEGIANRLGGIDRTTLM